MAKKETGIVNIKGRDYKTVALRMTEFREKHSIDDGWSIRTKIHQCDDQQVIVEANIVSPDERIVATGHAQEVWQGQINSTSALENCETSACGRALAMAGFIGSEFASADEVQRAIGHQQSGHTNRPKSAPRNAKPENGTQAQETGDPAKDAIIRRIANIPPSKLVDAFLQAQNDKTLSGDAYTWSDVCDAFAVRGREVLKPGSKEALALCGLLEDCDYASKPAKNKAATKGKGSEGK